MGGLDWTDYVELTCPGCDEEISIPREDLELIAAPHLCDRCQSAVEALCPESDGCLLSCHRLPCDVKERILEQLSSHKEG